MIVSNKPGPGYQKHPDYKVELSAVKGTVCVSVENRTIASTQNALVIEETGILPVYYIPRSDLIAEYFAENPKETYCPFKGTARYWNICIDGNIIEQCVWGYDEPYDEVAVLSNYVAFYSDKVSLALAD